MPVATGLRSGTLKDVRPAAFIQTCEPLCFDCRYPASQKSAQLLSLSKPAAWSRRLSRPPSQCHGSAASLGGISSPSSAMQSKAKCSDSLTSFIGFFGRITLVHHARQRRYGSDVNAVFIRFNYHSIVPHNRSSSPAPPVCTLSLESLSKPPYSGKPRV